MKKFLCLLLAVMLIASLFVACESSDGNETEQPTEQIADIATDDLSNDSTEAPQPEKLTAPVVLLEGNVAKWSANEKAERFEVSINGELIYLENSVTERTLVDGQTFKIRAIGDGLNYTTSDWSNLVTYTAPTAEEPTETPTEEKPTEAPTEAPTEEKPTEAPTEAPTEEKPTEAPTEEKPTEDPTEEKPTEAPTEAPTEEKPTEAPTEEKPTEAPTEAPTEEMPTETPTEEKPTESPTEPPVVEPSYQENILSFADTSSRVSITASSSGEQVWSANGITLTNVGHVADYSNPVRLYKNTSVTITCTDMAKIVFACFNETYASELANSIGAGAGYTVTADGKSVTVEFNAIVNEFGFTCSTAQIRLDLITVTSIGASDPGGNEGGSTTPSGNGTLEAPLTTTDAYNANASLRNEEFSTAPFYVKGTVTAIESKGNYYKNVYISDGVTSLRIYTINMGDGISGFDVGDTIVAYGYFVNYNDDIGLATYKPDNTTKIYVYAVSVENGNGGNQGGTTPPSSGHTYNDFDAEQKALFTSTVGLVIPFIPNDEYEVETQELEGITVINFYAYDNTEAEFDAYLDMFSSYTFEETYVDDYGDTCYVYVKGDVVVDICYYLVEDDPDYGTYSVVDVYVYLYEEDYNGDSGNEGGSGSTTPSDVDLITNDGKGLPQDEDGVFDVDFTKAENVKDVTDQGYYLDGCPTTGTGENAPAVLVIPVEFSDITAQSKGYTTANIEKIFNGTGNDTIYYSVDEYFKKSSYGKLDLNITVLDDWFKPKYNSSYYENYTYDYYGDEIAIGDQLILDEALAYLEDIMDLSQFDSDDNGVIDAVVLVTTLEIGEDDFHWAYRYWNIYTDDDGYYYEYDAVSANDYVWLSYQFMFESDSGYTETDTLNPYTFIHEFSHVLGADDYYDTSYSDESTSGPLNGADMMDAMQGDHNPYTKFNYGWITSSRLIVADSAVTVELEAFAENGDTIIIANNWDESLGAYQEYFVVMYYTNDGLNAEDYGYFARDGILVYHINASLYAESYDGEIYYDVYYNNTDPSDQYGTEENLIEFVRHSDGEDMIYTYVEGDSLPTVNDDAGNALKYTFTVVSIENGVATLTFTKR